MLMQKDYRRYAQKLQKDILSMLFRILNKFYLEIKGLLSVHTVLIKHKVNLISSDHLIDIVYFQWLLKIEF